MDACKPALDCSPSPCKARLSTPEDGADVFRWPTPRNGVGSATDAKGAAQQPEPPRLWTAVFDYEATAEDELSLRRGDLVEVLSKDSLVSGDEGWWTGVIAERVGIFPCNYVSQGKGIPEEMRGTPERRYPVPPLHREYPIVHASSPLVSPLHRCTGLCHQAGERSQGVLCHGAPSAGLETASFLHPLFNTLCRHTNSQLRSVMHPASMVTLQQCILSRMCTEGCSSYGAGRERQALRQAVCTVAITSVLLETKAIGR